ncbi:hypothetical protein Misp01_78780 [Microtetraspora sp. NBRC 13810]|uniref:DedA family protein n=1 Tax=Microtetraspora sp. NBRC 13810 TaxID=3030990 RepID=UPI0024A19E4E|nr:DedA family protein [Microtetraspora sp. NBRC 13810]GLW12750.1 hypothetical protein Misp01_78780 [Microtetraspora sp. NBRC 13810]
MSDLLGHLPGPLLVIVAGLLLTAESALVLGLLLPGTGLLFALGLFTHLGVLTPATALTTAIGAALCGGNLAYYFGRRRRSLPSISPLAAMVPEPAWHRLRALTARHGGWAVAVCQWLGGTRPLAARVAGWSGMPYRTFVTAHLPSAALWATTLVQIGRFAGEQIQNLISGGLTLAGPIVIGVLLLGFWLRRRWLRQDGHLRRDELVG